MLKNPWRKDGSIRYFELIKIAIIVAFFSTGFSLYLETTIALAEISGIMSFIMMLLCLVQVLLLNYDLFKVIKTLLVYKLIRYIKSYIIPFKVLNTLNVRFPKLKTFQFGLSKPLKYRVLRI